MNAKQKMPVRILVIASLIVLMLFVLFPYYWLIICSIKPKSEIFSAIPSFFPKNITLEGYQYAFSSSPGPDLMNLLSNSLVVSIITAVISCIFAATGGYAIGRKHFPGISAIVVFLMLAQMFQGPVIMVPWYKMAASMHVLNTKLGLILIYLTSTIPVGVWLMSGFFKDIPRELEEAAQIDGCGQFRTFIQIVMPLSKGGLVSITIYSFILAWNDYQYALILTNSAQAKTVQLGISELIGGLGVINWGGILACGVVVTLPVVILFSVIQKYLVEGMTAGAVKG